MSGRAKSRWMVSSLPANGRWPNGRSAWSWRCSACAAPWPPPPGSIMAIRPRRWPPSGRRPSCWLHCLRQPGLPSPSNRARLPPRPPQRIRPPRNRRQQPHQLSPNPPPRRPLAAAAPSAEPGQLQSMAQDLATMGQQVEELKATIAQLKASQAQMARELAKASEAKAAETRPAEQNLRPRVSALTPPAPRPAVPAARAQAEAGLFLFAGADSPRRSRSAAPAGASRRTVAACAAQANDRRRRRAGGAPADAAAIVVRR